VALSENSRLIIELATYGYLACPRHPQVPSVGRFVRTIKRDYVRVSACPDANTVVHQLSAWINHCNEVCPPKALGYRSSREFIAAHGSL
jgi:putative transposase